MDKFVLCHPYFKREIRANDNSKENIQPIFVKLYATINKLRVYINNGNSTSLIIPTNPNSTIENIRITHIFSIIPNKFTNSFQVTTSNLGFKDSHEFHFINYYKLPNLSLFNKGIKAPYISTCTNSLEKYG